MEIKSPNTIQPREHSRGSGSDSFPHKIFVLNVNWNGEQWNVNVNRFDNDNEWNADNQLFLRNCLFSPDPHSFVANGSFCICARDLFQPNIIFPVSSRIVETAMY